MPLASRRLKRETAGPPRATSSASGGDLDRDLIQMPLLARARQPPSDLISDVLAELARPLSDSLVADDDATCGQHLLDHAQAEREAEVQPNRVADDLSRKSVVN